MSELSGFADLRELQKAHREWIEGGLENGLAARDDRWSEAIAVGGVEFVQNIKNQLGVKAVHREVIADDGGYALREAAEVYAGDFSAKWKL